LTIFMRMVIKPAYKNTSRELWANLECRMPVFQFLRSHAGASAMSVQ
jgi:hypothetical protein